MTQNNFQNDIKINAKSLQKSIIKQLPTYNPKNMQKVRAPRSSRKSAPGRPVATLGRSWRAKVPPKNPQGTPKHPRGRRRTSKCHPKYIQMISKTLQKEPFGHTKVSKRHEKHTQDDTPKKPKLKTENRCNRYRDSSSNDATSKQQCVENDLGPAECAERLNKVFNRFGNDFGRHLCLHFNAMLA